jgi:hypothetical protein
MQSYSQSFPCCLLGLRYTGHLGLYSGSCRMAGTQMRTHPLWGTHRPPLDCIATAHDRMNTPLWGSHIPLSCFPAVYRGGRTRRPQSLGYSMGTLDRVCCSHCRPRTCSEACHRADLILSHWARYQVLSWARLHRTSLCCCRALVVV